MHHGAFGAFGLAAPIFGIFEKMLQVWAPLSGKRFLATVFEDDFPVNVLKRKEMFTFSSLH